MRLASVCLAAVACGGSETTTPPSGLVLCSPPMAVTADVSRGPQFRWTPACGATYMEVTSADKQQVLWAVRVDTGKIAPGVIYGSSPPASELLFGPLPLVAGTAYLARVGIRVQENSFAIFGEGAFVR